MDCTIGGVVADHCENSTYYFENSNYVVVFDKEPLVLPLGVVLRFQGDVYVGKNITVTFNCQLLTETDDCIQMISNKSIVLSATNIRTLINADNLIFLPPDMNDHVIPKIVNYTSMAVIPEYDQYTDYLDLYYANISSSPIGSRCGYRKFQEYPASLLFYCSPNGTLSNPFDVQINYLICNNTTNIYGLLYPHYFTTLYINEFFEEEEDINGTNSYYRTGFYMRVYPSFIERIFDHAELLVFVEKIRTFENCFPDKNYPSSLEQWVYMISFPNPIYSNATTPEPIIPPSQTTSSTTFPMLNISIRSIEIPHIIDSIIYILLLNIIIITLF